MGSGDIGDEDDFEFLKMGSGLGLLICNKVLKSIGGDLIVERYLETGGCIYLE
ncbi:hypothetical protein [Morganella morganii]|uniref:hypothetical protein n=1 Tax=Morganella morganii TaxID=582 RepID=UPI0013D0CE3B|nr:hypothetical protein [Morganella morganii]